MLKIVWTLINPNFSVLQSSNIRSKVYQNYSFGVRIIKLKVITDRLPETPKGRSLPCRNNPGGSVEVMWDLYG